MRRASHEKVVGFFSFPGGSSGISYILYLNRSNSLHLDSRAYKKTLIFTPKLINKINIKSAAIINNMRDNDNCTLYL